MNGFTAEDFAQATLATRGDIEMARRSGPTETMRWLVLRRDGEWEWINDAEMADEGWTPVMESRITEHTLRDTQEKAARKREKLVDHIADQDRVIRRRNDEIKALRRELADAQAPLSLDVLAAAWGAAEVPTEDAPICEGDVLIYPLFAGYGVRPSWGDSPLPEARILSRAPKPREPWQELADAMHAALDEGVERVQVEWAAQKVCELGWRKGGDES